MCQAPAWCYSGGCHCWLCSSKLLTLMLRDRDRHTHRSTHIELHIFVLTHACTHTHTLLLLLSFTLTHTCTHTKLAHRGVHAHSHQQTHTHTHTHTKTERERESTYMQNDKHIKLSFISSQWSTEKKKHLHSNLCLPRPTYSSPDLPLVFISLCVFVCVFLLALKSTP